MKETSSETFRSSEKGPAFETEAERASQNRAKIYCSAVSYESIRPVREEILLERHFDLAVVYYLQEIRNHRKVLTPVTHELAKEMGLSAREIAVLAWKNTILEKEAVIRPLSEILGKDELFGMPPLYVLSNEEMHFGAVTMFYPGLLSVIADEFGCDLCILPSSIHEVILLPVEPDTDFGALHRIVSRVNDTEVEKEDILSYNVYRFNRRNDGLEIDNF